MKDGDTNGNPFIIFRQCGRYGKGGGGRLFRALEGTQAMHEKITYWYKPNQHLARVTLADKNVLFLFFFPGISPPVLLGLS